ncbi:MAG: diacylglycerol kinase catalytic region, partial [Chloroflexi bacterium]|nr:diacylglycerol kinase catalytic region [Chloroflexota bacterium]
PAGATVAVLGGDGTLNEVINGLAGKDCLILLLPCGSGNDLARGLRIVRDPLALLATTAWREIGLDLGEVAGRLFANNAGVGLDGEVCRLIQNCDESFRGQLGYVRAFLSCALNLRATPIHITYDGIEQRYNGLLLTFANGQYYGRGMKIAPDANPCDGLLDVCAVLELDRIGLLRAFPRVYTGSHIRHPSFRLWRAHTVTLYGARPLSIHTDGEVVGRLSTEPSKPTVVRIAARRQRFLVPQA